MASIIKPSKMQSFSDLRSIPVDRLDSQIQNLVDAIHSTQLAILELRNAKQPSPLPNPSLAAMEHRLLQTGAAIAGVAEQVSTTARETDLRALDAERAAVVARAAAAAVEAVPSPLATPDEEASEAWAVDSQNWANWSQANATNAKTDQELSGKWAEYLAGPVVNPAEAPAYISGSPWGHGLYYQPVEGGLAGLWSSKWWALYAQKLVGSWSFYYLGSWADPPIPGSVNPDTGQLVPNPLAPGSFYYDTSTNQLYVWNGTQWEQPFAPVVTPGYQSSYTYIATAGQTNFQGIDAFGRVPVVGDAPSDVHINGMRLVYATDYVVDQANSILALTVPATVGDIVQWDLLFTLEDFGGGGININKVAISPPPDGTNKNFTLSYLDAGGASIATDVSGAAQLQLSLDGIVQEPGIDFLSLGANLTMAAAPPASAHFWGLWFAAGAVAAPPADAPPINVSIPVISGNAMQGSTLVSSPGSWTGYPTPTRSWQWKSNGVNVGTNLNSYVTQPSDVGHNITVVVTATNTQGSASATSAAFGPITIALDTTPDPFTFIDVTNATLSTVYTSNAVAITGINAPSPLTITGGEYSINGGGWDTAPVNVSSGASIVVRGTSAAAFSAAVNVQLVVGGETDTFTITTVASDTTPDAFTFTDVTNAAFSTVYTSNAITVAGINNATLMTITGGTYSVNGGAYSSANTTVVAGNTVTVRGTSSSVAATTVSVTLTIGGVSDTFAISTASGYSPTYFIYFV